MYELTYIVIFVFLSDCIWSCLSRRFGVMKQILMEAEAAYRRCSTE